MVPVNEKTALLIGKELGIYENLTEIKFTSIVAELPPPPPLSQKVLIKETEPDCSCLEIFFNCVSFFCCDV